MVNQYIDKVEPIIHEGMKMRQLRYNDIDTNFEVFAQNRNSGFLKQFTEIFMRNLKYLIRNKQSLAAVFFNSFIIALMLLSVFYEIL